jgi:retron-type reverse transcriptase
LGTWVGSGTDGAEASGAPDGHSSSNSDWYDKEWKKPSVRESVVEDLGKLRPLVISTLRDRVGLTAAMLVLDPIFEADLPPEQYAYRRGRNAQQAAVEVELNLLRRPRRASC